VLLAWEMFVLTSIIKHHLYSQKWQDNPSKKMASQRTHEAVATEPILKRKGGEDHVKQLLKPLSALK